MGRSSKEFDITVHVDETEKLSKETKLEIWVQLSKAVNILQQEKHHELQLDRTNTTEKKDSVLP